MNTRNDQGTIPCVGTNDWECGEADERAPPSSRPSAPASMFHAALDEGPRTDERLELGRELASRLSDPPRGKGTLVVLRAPEGENLEDVVCVVEDTLAASGEPVARIVFRRPERGRESFIGRTRVNGGPFRGRREYRCGAIASARDLDRFDENRVFVVLEADRFVDPEELIGEAYRYGKRVLAILSGPARSVSAESALLRAAREVRTVGPVDLRAPSPKNTPDNDDSDNRATRNAETKDAAVVGLIAATAYFIGVLFGRALFGEQVVYRR